MKKIIAFLIIISTVLSCNSQDPKQFSAEALKDSFINLEGNSVTLQNILEKTS